MGSFLTRMFHSDFMPHGFCWEWEPWVVWINVVSDLAIFLCYMIIGTTLLKVTFRRRDVISNPVVALFGAFIVFCGCTHAMEVFNTWHGMFRLAGVVKLATAVVSMLAVAPLMEILPKLLAVPALTDVLNLKAALSTEQQEKLRMAGQLQESEADRALLQRQKLESLGILAGGIAHDFNNLLGAMQGNVELALLEDSPKRARPYLETLEALMDRGAGLLRQIMAYSGRGRLALCTVHLNQLVQDLTRLLGTSISKKASIRLDLHPGLPALEGDRSQLEQVVMNLVLNASEAIGDQPGVITIATRPERLEPGDPAGTDPDQPLPPGPYVALVVADSGCGMTPEVLERIFEPFFTTKFTGRGLGLAAIHGIVRGHRGSIRVASDPGRGSTFRILLPSVPEAPTIPNGPAPSTAPAGLVAAARPTPDATAALGTVLVVDDDPEMRAVMAKGLERAGFRTLQARDGQEALDRFWPEQDRIRLILMDLTMPVMDGAEACRELRRRRAAVPVLLCSGFDQREALSRFEGLGPAGFLQKPFTMAKLAQQVHALLGPGHGSTDGGMGTASAGTPGWPGA